MLASLLSDGFTSVHLKLCWQAVTTHNMMTATSSRYRQLTTQAFTSIISELLSTSQTFQVWATLLVKHTISDLLNMCSTWKAEKKKNFCWRLRVYAAGSNELAQQIPSSLSKIAQHLPREWFGESQLQSRHLNYQYVVYLNVHKPSLWVHTFLFKMIPWITNNG